MAMNDFLVDGFWIFVTVVLLFVNGFFVAAEFALVRIRHSKLDALVEQNRRFSRTARWLLERQTASLSVCQIGVTMASLGLGWLGEPALARLIRPVLLTVGITSEAVLHSVAFTVAFAVITAVLIIVGELVPKLYAIRRTEFVSLSVALPLRVFYILFYPFMALLNSSSNLLLRWVGVEKTGDEDLHSEEEIRKLLSHAHTKGELTPSEHRLLNAVFEFDDHVCRQIMVPRGDIVIFEVNQPFPECLALARRTKHTRFPLCKGSLDEVVGVVHVKDLLGLPPDKPFDLAKIARPPQKVPETMPISHLLRVFQSARQHMALVVDEYGTIVGMVTLENVLEQIVGAVQDEFDSEMPNIVPDGPGRFVVLGNTSLESINAELNTNLQSHDVDTISGLLVEHVGRTLRAGEQVDLDGLSAEVLEVRGVRATRLRIRLTNAEAQSRAAS